MGKFILKKNIMKYFQIIIYHIHLVETSYFKLCYVVSMDTITQSKIFGCSDKFG